MRKYKSGSEKEKYRREPEVKLRKVVAKSKKVTDFFDVSEPKSNSVETASSRLNASMQLLCVLILKVDLHEQKMSSGAELCLFFIMSCSLLQLCNACFSFAPLHSTCVSF